MQDITKSHDASESIFFIYALPHTTLVSAGRLSGLLLSALRGISNFVVIGIYLSAIEVSINSLSEWKSVIKKRRRNKFKISNKKGKKEKN